MAAIKSRRELNYNPGDPPPKVKSTASALVHTKLPPSLRVPSVLPSSQPVYGKHGPLPALREIPQSVGSPEEAELLSEAQQQLHKLLAKQLDTSAPSLQSALSNTREFTPAVVYQPLSDEVKGLATLSQYLSREEGMQRVEALRQLGLSQQEIELKLEESAPIVKKRRLGVEPNAQQDRMNAVNQKISERLKMVNEPTRFHGAKHMSRHAMEVERSLFRGSDRENPLGHLTKEGRSTHEMAYPKSLMPQSDEPKDEEISHTPNQLPSQVIERNRLTLAEIRALPRFRDYQPGTPNKVLYLKNLHARVSAEDLRAVFGEGPSIRLMTGQMKGQAFLEFSLDAATKALQLVNGYKIREKPIIISYGRPRSKHKQTS